MNLVMDNPGVLIILPLLFYIFILYCLVSTVLFMKRKLQLDKERNQKLDQLIQTMEKQQLSKQPTE